MLKFLYKGDPVNIMANGGGSATYRETLPHVQRALPECMSHRLEKRVCLVSVQNIITIKNPYIQEVSTQVFCKMSYDEFPMHCDCAEKHERIYMSSDREGPLSPPCRKRLASANKQECLCSKTIELSNNVLAQSPETASETNAQQKAMCPVSPSRASPFKSPATQRVVNLKVSRETLSQGQRSIRSYEGFRNISCGTDESLDPASKQKMFNNALPAKAGTSQNEDLSSVHSNKMQPLSVKSPVEKILDSGSDSLMPQAKRASTTNRSSSMFCGIPKAKKCEIEVKSMDSLISSILNTGAQKCRGVLLRRPPILQEKTNSPMNRLSDIHQVADLKFGDGHSNLPNSRFFLKDLDFEEEGETEDKENDIDKHTDVSYRTVSREHLKMKEANTKANEGYTTVITRKKAVIELFNCPKTYFRKSTRSRQVYFDVNGWVSAHNDDPNIKSIYIEDTAEPSFEWGGEKAIVDIVKRVDLELEFD